MQVADRGCKSLFRPKRFEPTSNQHLVPLRFFLVISKSMTGLASADLAIDSMLNDEDNRGRGRFCIEYSPALDGSTGCGIARSNRGAKNLTYS